MLFDGNLICSWMVISMLFDGSLMVISMLFDGILICSLMVISMLFDGNPLLGNVYVLNVQAK